MVGFGLENACAHIIILAEISSENLLPIRADFVTERVTTAPAVKRCRQLRTTCIMCRVASQTHTSVVSLDGALARDIKMSTHATVYCDE